MSVKNIVLRSLHLFVVRQSSNLNYSIYFIKMTDELRMILRVKFNH